MHNNLGNVYRELDELDDAIKSYKKAIAIKPDFVEAFYSLGVIYQEQNILNNALKSYLKVLSINPGFAEAHNNLGTIFSKLNRLEEAEASFKKALAIDPYYAGAYYNFGNTLKDLNRIVEAEASFRKAIAINPYYAEAHNNLGNVIVNPDSLVEAEASFRKAIAIDPDFAVPYNNLGNLLVTLEKLGDAEASFRKAIALKPDYAQAYSNLGANLKDLGRFEEAEACCRKAIALDQKYADAHCNLCFILYANGDFDSAIKIIKKANSINPKSKTIKLLLTILQARIAQKTFKKIDDTAIYSDFNRRLTSNPLILKRAVESELINNLYEMKLLELDKVKDPSYGNAKGSGYDLFTDSRSIIRTVEEDLINMNEDAIKTNVYIDDSFFTILGSGGGVDRHNHIGDIDKDSNLNLASQKYSLVYYLSVGDQKCIEPGILKLYNPTENILPHDGMITIFPAERYHSVTYNGKKDRVMIGINFYCL